MFIAKIYHVYPTGPQATDPPLPLRNIRYYKPLERADSRPKKSAGFELDDFITINAAK